MNFVLTDLNHFGATHCMTIHLIFGGLISFQPFFGISGPMPPSLFNSATLKFNWAPGHAGTLKIMSMLISLLKLEQFCSVPSAMVPCSLSPTIAETHYTQCRKWKCHISHLNCQISPDSLVLNGIGPTTPFTL